MKLIHKKKYKDREVEIIFKKGIFTQIGCVLVTYIGYKIIKRKGFKELSKNLCYFERELLDINTGDINMEKVIADEVREAWLSVRSKFNLK